MPIQVAFEGPIAAGKTTWAKLLAPVFAAELVLEEFETNDYLVDYYQEPARWALPMQLWFLTARHEQLSNLNISSMLVADYGLLKEDVFSLMLFNGRDLRLYTRIRKQLGTTAPSPRFLVYVDADTPTLLRRIRERGRDYEKTIDAMYLDAVPLKVAFAARFRGNDSSDRSIEYVDVASVAVSDMRLCKRRVYWDSLPKSSRVPSAPQRDDLLSGSWRRAA